jgi:hypothetical protein
VHAAEERDVIGALWKRLVCRRILRSCDPDWVEAIMLGLDRPKCMRCRRVIP